MWVYLKTRVDAWKSVFEVGFFSPDGRWYFVKKFNKEDHAAEYVHYLNGG